jgi:bifunctional DNA-binding transcriptional regulator/antitoxin component of YhaV-PrlF toxin-antitoxin module
MSITARITKKGQVTIPRKIRDKLKSEVIQFDIVEDDVVIRPVKSVAGSLKPYAKKGFIPFKEAKKKAWEEVVRRRYGEKADLNLTDLAGKIEFAKDYKYKALRLGK